MHQHEIALRKKTHAIVPLGMDTALQESEEWQSMMEDDDEDTSTKPVDIRARPLSSMDSDLPGILPWICLWDFRHPSQCA